MHIEFITTGGTIDKIYFDARSSYEVGDPVVGELLERMGVTFNYTINSALRKDSLEMSDKDREHIRRHVHASQAQYLIITHGTDGMVETAQVLGEFSDKVIVLTGALQPAAFHRTDAIFNIGCAIGAVQTLEPGVYIAMNGHVFKSSEVRKNLSTNRFEHSRS